MDEDFLFQRQFMQHGVGVVGIWMHNVLCGLFGPGAFFVPAVLAILGAGWRGAVEKNALLAKNLYAFSTIWMFI